MTASELAVAVAGRLLADLPEDARVNGYPERLGEALAASEVFDENGTPMGETHG